MTAARLFNVYCDESCHLEHDGIPVMAWGAVYCPAAEVCSELFSGKIHELEGYRENQVRCSPYPRRNKDFGRAVFIVAPGLTV